MFRHKLLQVILKNMICHHRTAKASMGLEVQAQTAKMFNSDENKIRYFEQQMRGLIDLETMLSNQVSENDHMWYQIIRGVDIT